MNRFLETCYKNHPLPKDILDKLDANRDIIMTAGGSKDFQIPEHIRYVIFELRYIPTKIIIYEDRPEHFIEYRELIESILGTKLTIMKVEMDGNRGYKRIEAV